jgi:hypothetical protein
VGDSGQGSGRSSVHDLEQQPVQQPIQQHGPQPSPRGPDRDDRLTWVSSGLLAFAVLADLGALAVIWWYRQAALGWSAPNPRLWRIFLGLATALAALALALAIIAVIRRHGARGRAGGVAWAVLAGAVLIGSPILVDRLAPEGQHAVVVAIDPVSGDVRWRVETGGWFIRDPAVIGHAVVLLTVGDERGPCDGVLRRLTLDARDGTTISLLPMDIYEPRAPSPDYAVRGNDLVRVSDPTSDWRVGLDALGLASVSNVAAGADVVVVTADGELPLSC